MTEASVGQGAFQSRRAVIAQGLAAASTPVIGQAAPVSPVARTLSNPKASAQARALYGFLWKLYGSKTLTGQQELGTAKAGPRVELDYLQRVSAPPNPRQSRCSFIGSAH